MSPISPVSAPPAGAVSNSGAPDDPEGAARQFEAVLARQFVEVMTKDLFRSEGGGALAGQSDLQRDTLTDVLAEHLTESGTLGVADLLVEQWGRQGRIDTPASDATTDGVPVGSAPDAAALTPFASRPLSMIDALRVRAATPAAPIATPPQAPPGSLDPTNHDR